MKFIKNHQTNPYFNLAFEEYILKHHTGREEYFLLWQNAPAVIVGRHQNTIEEINLEVIEKYNIQVVRRESGGGAVYHDLGNLNFSFISNFENEKEISMDKFTDPVTKALKKLGIYASISGRNDLIVDGKKVSGNAQTIYKNRILHHGTLLFDTDINRAQMVLNVSPDKVLSKSTKSVRSRIGNLKDFFPKEIDMDMDGFKKFLISEFTDEEEWLEESEMEAIYRLEKEKYNTWEWNYGESPVFDIRSRNRYEGGILQVGICVENNRIKKIQFFGDFMSAKATNEIENMMCGRRFRKEDVRDVLRQFDLKHYFGLITEEEIIHCIFYR